MLKIVSAAVAAALLIAAPAFACDTIISARVKLSACVDGATWAVQAPQGVQEYLYYSTDGNVGFAVITEADTAAVSEYRQAILSNAVAAALDGSPDNVSVVSERIETIGGKAWNVIEYEVKTADQPILFQNFYYVQPGFGSTQMVYWSVPQDATSAAYRAGQMLATLEFGQ